ncbi:MAG: hypothetical protein ACRDF4_12170, partial [Rhabdochlamydiaceae bacterium]
GKAPKIDRDAFLLGVAPKQDEKDEKDIISSPADGTGDPALGENSPKFHTFHPFHPNCTHPASYCHTCDTDYGNGKKEHDKLVHGGAPC